MLLFKQWITLRVWVCYGPGQVEQSDPKVVVSYAKIYENFANYFLKMKLKLNDL